MIGRGSFSIATLLALGCRPVNAEIREDPSPSGHADTPQSPVTPAGSSVAPPASHAPALAVSAAREPGKLHCRQQPAQEFLLRQNYIVKPGVSASERKRRAEAREYAIRYRNRQYGHVPGVGRRTDPSRRAMAHATQTTFMGNVVVVHEKIVPALNCVQAALQRDCSSHPYRPKHISGFRERNSFIDYEVSNHLYGIALDIDSSKNPCCGCIGKWQEHPACKRPGSVYDRMVMPRCWVDVFERYGFHWLGRDEMEDSMHFEFLGDPAGILE